MEINSFDEWLNTLSDALDQAHAIGMSDETITKSARQLGDFLARNVEPDVPENKLLKELWQGANDDERQALTSMIIKVVDNKKVH